MTPYTLTYWVKKQDDQWEQVVERFYANSLDEAKAKVMLPENASAYNVALEENVATPYEPPRKKNTNAWQAKRYGK